MKFTIHGPFKLRRRGKVIDHLSESKRSFWAEVDNKVENLSCACGCYLFAIRAGKGVRPWYVGKSERQRFYSEVLSPHKLTIYNSITANQKGTPIMFLIAKRSKGLDKFSKPTKRRTGNRFINELEKLLIGAALEKNGSLMNIKDSKILRKMIVPGFINSKRGANKKSVRDFGNALFKKA